MYQYSFETWLAFFYFYCIVGWIYESVEVSIRQKKISNRGFMKGPWLPVYGSGAVIILFCTLPFKDSPVAVFFVGMISATILEYFTGVIMLKLFKVRYWDYSYRKIQFQGHICLLASLVWGGFSVCMDYLIHEPVEKFIFGIPANVLSILTFAITVGFVYDFANAFRDAMDLRAMIIRMEELKKQYEAAAAERREKFEQSMEERREEFEEKRAEFGRAMEGKRKELQINIDWNIAEMNERKVEIENKIEELLSSMERPARHLFKQYSGSKISSISAESDILRERILNGKKK